MKISSDIKDRTMRTTVSAMISALGTVILYFGSVVNLFDLTAVAVVSFLMFFSVIEVGKPYSFATYGVISVLSLLLLPDKFSAVAFMVLGGLYPLVRPLIMKTGRYFSYFFRLALFNVLLTLIIAASMFVLHVEDEDLGFNIFTYGICNFAFIFYDFVITAFLDFYSKFLRKRLKLDKLFGNGGKN